MNLLEEVQTILNLVALKVLNERIQHLAPIASDLQPPAAARPKSLMMIIVADPKQVSIGNSGTSPLLVTNDLMVGTLHSPSITASRKPTGILQAILTPLNLRGVVMTAVDQTKTVTSEVMCKEGQ